MIYSLQKLQCDVLARLGETVQSPTSHPELGLPAADEIIAQKLRIGLPDVGKRLIEEASLAELGGSEAIETAISMRRMPCGLYAAEMTLPSDLVRICSVKMRSWAHGISGIFMPQDAGWYRQWSSEPGIAGCMERPQAYLIVENAIKIRALGSESPSDNLESLSGWKMPEVDEDGNFRFPSSLYPALVGSII